VDHDEPARRIDEDRLAVHAQEGKHPPLSRQDPHLIPIPNKPPGGARPEMRLIVRAPVMASLIHAAGMSWRPRQLPSCASSKPSRA
jgi:hypothetical protein